MEFKNIRRHILQLRDALSMKERLQYSTSIMEKILLLEHLVKAETIFVYRNFRSEVITHFLIETMLQMEKKVVLPVTLTEEKSLLPVFITNLEKDLAPGYASILEPIEEIRESQVVPPESIDIIILPGSVFDERGGRMGYGGGYYDRFVSQKAPQALRVGLGYEMQIVKKAPLQDHDEILDLIVTEERTVSGRR